MRKIKQNTLDLNRGLSSDFWSLRNANQVKFTEECICKGEACFRQIYNWNKHGLALNNLSQKDYRWKYSDTLVKKEFRSAWSIRKATLTVFWYIKGSIIIDFIVKGATVNSAYYCQLLRKKLHYLLNDPRVYIYIYIYIYIFVCVCVCVCVRVRVCLCVCRP